MYSPFIESDQIAHSALSLFQINGHWSSPETAGGVDFVNNSSKKPKSTDNFCWSSQIPPDPQAEEKTHRGKHGVLEEMLLFVVTSTKVEMFDHCEIHSHEGEKRSKIEDFCCLFKIEQHRA